MANARNKVNDKHSGRSISASGSGTIGKSNRIKPARIEERIGESNGQDGIVRSDNESDDDDDEDEDDGMALPHKPAKLERLGKASKRFSKRATPNGKDRAQRSGKQADEEQEVHEELLLASASSSLKAELQVTKLRVQLEQVRVSCRSRSMICAISYLTEEKQIYELFIK